MVDGTGGDWQMWKSHFQKIKKVCPWSWKAWNEGKIKIVQLETIQHLNEYDAIVYEVEDIDEDSLDAYVQELNEEYTEYEFLWSHPTHTKGGKNQTPVPVIIQQDRKLLEELRQGIKDGVNTKTAKTT